MKSLDIINKQIEHDKDQLEFYLDNGVPKSKLKNMYKDIEKAEIIKRDLEVLEIMKKYITSNRKLAVGKLIPSCCFIIKEEYNPKEYKRVMEWVEYES